ncbi:MAG: beta-ketoacyl-ACP synthase II [bacterium]
MKINQSELEHFKNLIGLFNSWEYLEDVCEKTIGVGIQIIEPSGKFVSERQHSSKFCQLVQSSKSGYKRCKSFYLNSCFGKEVIKKGLCLFKCHAGLTNLFIPIAIGDIPLATIVIGGILDKSPDLQQYKKYAKELGIDTKALINYIQEIKIVSDEDIVLLNQMLKPRIDTIKEGMINYYHLFEKSQYLYNLLKEMEELLKVDELTSFLTKNTFLDCLDEEILIAKSQNQPLALIMIDIDNFSSIKNTYGLFVGDRIIKELANMVRENLPKDAVGGRYEGDIFGIILKGTKEEIDILAKDLQLKVKNYIFGKEDRLNLSLSISIGIANITKSVSNSQGLIKNAMEKLLISKKEGGGKVVTIYTKRPHKPRVVITGIGIISPVGIGKEVFWQAISTGKSGIGRITSFDPSNLPVQIAAEVKDFDPVKYMDFKTIKRTDRTTQFAIAAAKMAVEDAKLDISKEEMTESQVTIGSTIGGLSFGEDQMKKFLRDGADRISPFASLAIFTGAISSMISLELKLKGPAMTISTGCTAGTDAIGEVFNNIREGKGKLAIVGGTEVTIKPFILSSYYAMGALVSGTTGIESASRPFDIKRSGFVAGEGAGIVILEELEHALNRNAHIYSEVIGYSTTTDAYHITAPDPSGVEAIRAINLALIDAGIKPEEVDYINAHGTSTPLNDKIETMIIKKIFGDHAYEIPVSSTKSILGHSIGAAGAIEAIVCALAIENSFIPPTINYEYPDPECDLDYVPNVGRKININIAVSNTFGFGGKNSILVFSRYNES